MIKMKVGMTATRKSWPWCIQPRLGGVTKQSYLVIIYQDQPEDTQSGSEDIQSIASDTQTVSGSPSNTYQQIGILMPARNNEAYDIKWQSLANNKPTLPEPEPKITAVCVQTDDQITVTRVQRDAHTERQAEMSEMGRSATSPGTGSAISSCRAFARASL
jgi:hypothetical protein